MLLNTIYQEYNSVMWTLLILIVSHSAEFMRNYIIIESEMVLFIGCFHISIRLSKTKKNRGPLPIKESVDKFYFISLKAVEALGKISPSPTATTF